MPYKVGERVVYGLGERGSGFKKRANEDFQDYSKIMKACQAKMEMFEDDSFPATAASIGNIDAIKQDKSWNVVWKRPKEIVSNPKLFVDGADRFDVKQGALGNCWFLAATANLTMNQDFFNFTVPKDNTLHQGYYGAMHFRFWQFGKWIEVVIDDRLPCLPDGTLAFVRSQAKNEMWAPLLEKAFAKLNGSYEAIEGGFTFEGLEDFTGGFTEIFLFQTLKNMKIVKDENELFKLMLLSNERSSFMGSSVKGHSEIKETMLPNGLIKDHAYSITGLQLVKLKTGEGYVQLIRLRNPWGNKDEWNGQFSDSHPSWDEFITQEDRVNLLQATFEADGEFWMSFDDFLENFSRIELCHVSPDASATLIGKHQAKHEHWNHHAFDGKWTHDVTDGGPLAPNGHIQKNPQFKLNLGTKDDENEYVVIVALLKKERKEERKAGVKGITFEVYDVSKMEKPSKPLNAAFVKQHHPVKKYNPPGGVREATIRFKLPAGRYIIIPCTKEPGCDGEFLLRVFTEGNSRMKVYDKEIGYNENKKEVDLKEDSPEEIEKKKQLEAFFKTVADQDEQVDWWELKMVLDKTFHSEFKYEGFGFSEDSARAMVAMMDTDRSGKLGLSEFLNLWENVLKWKDIFNKCATPPAGGGPLALKALELVRAFKMAGYTVSMNVIGVLVRRYGDRQGQIWLEKFINAAIKSEAMFEQFKARDIDKKGSITLSAEEWLMDTLYS